MGLEMHEEILKVIVLRKVTGLVKNDLDPQMDIITRFR